MGDTSELYYAHMEADRNEAERAYFGARKPIDCESNRDMFRAGFERAYNKLWPLCGAPSTTAEKPSCPPCQLELGGERCADCGYQQADEKTGCSCTADEEAVCLVEPCPRAVTKHSTAVETFESLSKEKQ